MRSVLDTNVLVAAFVSRGTCHELVEHCARNHEIIGSETILDEFRRTLLVKLRIPPRQAEEAEALLRERFTMVPAHRPEAPVSRDPDDDLVLATALEGACTCLVTGDSDLLELGRWRRIEILRPADFWEFDAKGAGKGPGPPPSGAARGV